MAKPLVTFADPVEAIIDYLDARLDGRGEPYVQGVQVGAWHPDITPDLPGLPYVQVVSDGMPNSRYPIVMRATIRVTVWHTNPSPAHDLSSLVAGLMAVHPGDSRVYAVRTLTGPLPGVDKETGNRFSSLTFQVSVRPTPANS